MADDKEVRPGPINPGGPQFSVSVERTRGDAAPNRELKALGDRLKPAGYKHVGSIGIHIYKSRFGAAVLSITQNCTNGCTAVEANYALQQASHEVALSFGWKPPATRTDVMRREGRQNLDNLEVAPNQVVETTQSTQSEETPTNDHANTRPDNSNPDATAAGDSNPAAPDTSPNDPVNPESAR